MNPRTFMSLVAGLDDTKPLTVFALFRELGLEYPDFDPAAADWSLPDTARVGYASGAYVRDRARTVQQLQDWANDPSDARLVPWTVSTIEPSDDLALLALEVVQRGLAPVSDLNRLAYGRWTSSLREGTMTALLDSYLSADGGPLETEAAIVMLDVWLDAHQVVPDQLSSIGLRLIADAASQAADKNARSGMLDFDRNRLADKLRLSPQERLPSTIVAMKATGHVSHEDISALREMAREAPYYVVPRVLSLVAERGTHTYLIETEHLVSIVAESAGVELVSSQVLALDDESQLRVLRHIDFTSGTLDGVAERILVEHSADDRFRAEAINRFIFPGEVVMGSYASHLRGRLDQIRAIEDGHPAPAVRMWAQQTAAAISEIIPMEELRETEDDR
jgi:hypothetical protein